MNSSHWPAKPRALVLAPIGRDASVATMLLQNAGADAIICADLPDLYSRLSVDISLVVLTEETIRTADLRPLVGWIVAQPSWSDLPIILVTDHGGGPERNPAAIRYSEILGNVTFLERPFHPTTFISLAKTALRGRRRQYEARARLEELREGQERLRTALTAGHLGAWELDIGTATLRLSNTCKAHFGRSPDESFSYTDLLAVIHSDDRARVEAAVAQSLKTGEDFAIEYRNIWPDGSIHWAEVRARVVRNSANADLSLVGVSSDITDRKTAEEKLHRLNETLEQRVQERTEELESAHQAVLQQIVERQRAEDQLRHAQKMETIGQLTGGVAHDFNNLLMAVLGNLDLLRKRVSDPQSIRLIESALLGARRGAALTQRLLAFARRQDLQTGPVDLIALVNGMRELLARSVGPDINMIIDLPESLPPALADPNQVELALLNLVVNSRDAMPQGGTLRIVLDMVHPSADDDLAPGSYLRLAVSDTGHGMDEETLKRAIEPFFSTKALGKGTGLGLSMIHGLAVQLNGTLRLSSQVGQGTTAELWLPVTVGELPVASGPAPEKAVAAPPRSVILVVDDDALISMSTVAMLEDLGHHVVEANSGADALKILRSDQPIDLLITDHAMPEMTGVQLAKAARKIRPNLPILLATGYAELPHGMHTELPRLSKPYQQDQLAAQITTLLLPNPEHPKILN